MELPEFTFAFIIRAAMVLLGLGAMASLWIARRDRGSSWTGKTRDIWRAHFIAVFAVMQGNFEFLLRERNPPPTIGFYLFMVFLALTIRGTFRGDIYTKDQSEKQS